MAHSNANYSGYYNTEACLCKATLFRKALVHGHNGAIHSLASRSSVTGGLRALDLEYCAACGTVRVTAKDRTEGGGPAQKQSEELTGIVAV